MFQVLFIGTIPAYLVGFIVKQSLSGRRHLHRLLLVRLCSLGYWASQETLRECLYETISYPFFFFVIPRLIPPRRRGSKRLAWAKSESYVEDQDVKQERRQQLQWQPTYTQLACSWWAGGAGWDLEYEFETGWKVKFSYSPGDGGNSNSSSNSNRNSRADIVIESLHKIRALV